MITQTLALLWDAYRDLQARKMFWIVLALNVLGIGTFAFLGVKDGALTVLWFKVPMDARMPAAMALLIYKRVFSSLVVGFWFTWLATILALVSTAGIFPDFLASGSVDLFFAKPISRLRLFLTKYLAGLLFVTLQVTVFTVLGFFVLGARASLWQPGLFLAIPLVLLFFSYLFAICVAFGVWTRSTMAALLLTLLAWVVIWGADFSERLFLSNNISTQTLEVRIDAQIAAANTQIAQAEAAPQTEAASSPAGAATVTTRPVLTADELAQLERRRDALTEQRKGLEVTPSDILAQNISYGIKTVLPKTGDTMRLLDRLLFTDKDLRDSVQMQEEAAPATGPQREEFRERQDETLESNLKLQEVERGRSAWWIIGTSLIFEAVVLGLAARSFCRRDF